VSQEKELVGLSLEAQDTNALEEPTQTRVEPRMCMTEALRAATGQ